SQNWMLNPLTGHTRQPSLPVGPPRFLPTFTLVGDVRTRPAAVQALVIVEEPPMLWLSKNRCAPARPQSLDRPKTQNFFPPRPCQSLNFSGSTDSTTILYVPSLYLR